MIDVAMLEWDGIEQIVSALIDCFRGVSEDVYASV
jgi:hypothetical protein